MSQRLLAAQVTGRIAGAEAERLAVLQRSQLLDWPPEPEFDRWTAALREHTGAAVAALLLVDATRVFVKSLCTTVGAADEASELSLLEPLGEYLIGRVPPFGSGYGAPAYAEAPVSVGGRVLGWMAIADRSHRDWGDGDLRALDDAAAMVSTEVKLRLANQEAAGVRDLVGSHNRLHELIARDAPLRDVLGELVEGIEHYEPSVMPCVVLLDRESNTLHPGAAASLPREYFDAIDGVVIGPNVGTCGSAAWSGRLTITEDIAEDPKWAPIRDFAVAAGLRHCWSMPIKAPDGDVLGTFALYGPRPRHPLSEHLTLMRDGARLAGIAIERHRTMQKLTHDARHDALTGLPNRRAIFEHLDVALERVGTATKVAVLFVDLDGLKSLNDTLGHDRADEMIGEIGGRLSAAVRVDDFVGRFGGDEFVAIAEEVVGQEQAAELGLRLLEATSEPLRGIESTVVTASVGIALIGGVGTDAREAIRQADSAMYAAKRAGRDRCSFFADAQPPRTGRRQSLARELRDAEMRDEMRLVFQPVLDLARSEVVAVEALVRWNCPKFGEISATEFIPIAEDTGAIMPLGAWVLRESCEQLARIAERTGRPLELAVNVSAHQLAKTGFAQSVHQTLAHAEFPAQMLTLQITETALMAPDAVSARTLRELESLGVQIVLDDFGTGYSSLTWLKQHPIDGIKLDRGFVGGLPDDVTNRAIVAAIVVMARALRCTVTAKDVETEAQLDALRALNCERVQGSLLAQPMPADDLASLFHEPFRTPRTIRMTEPTLLDGTADLVDESPTGAIDARESERTEARALQARLEAANSRFAGVFEAASTGMALVAPDGRFLEVNPALCLLLARDADTLLASSFQELTHPADLAASLEQLQWALSGKIERFQQSKRYLLPDGGIVWGLLTLTIVRGSDGAPVHFVAQIQDITARKTSEGELRRYAAQLESLSERDALTGLSNQRAFDAALEEELSMLEAGGGPCSLLLASVRQDDSAVIAAAESLLGASRDSDLVAHLGAGELAVLLPGDNRQTAEAIARRTRETLSMHLDIRFSHAIAARGDSVEGLMEILREGLVSRDVASATRSPAHTPAGIGRLLELARRQLGMPVSFLTQIDGDDYFLARLSGEHERLGVVEGDVMPLADTHCQRMIDGRIGSTVADLAAEPETRDLDVTTGLGLRAYAGVPVRLRSGKIYGTLCAVDTQPHPELNDRHTELLSFVSELAAELIEDEAGQQAARRAEAGATGVRTLLIALEARDFYTGEHSKKVVALASAVARNLGLDESSTRDVEQVALLHDIGKVGIPDAILQKQGRLDDQEWQLMRQHPVVGERIIAGTPGLSHLAPAMRAEHERWDGGGYPDGLAGEQIPVASRITLACDALHAMTSDRPYRPAMTTECARQELRACAGSQFDPHVVKALLAEMPTNQEPAPPDLAPGAARMKAPAPDLRTPSPRLRRT